MKIDVTINAGQTLEYFEPGDFFRLLDATGPVDITFYSQGKEVSEAENIGEGFAEKFRSGTFDRVRITSATTQALQFVIRLGADVFYDKPPTGAVTIANVNGAFSQSQKTVTNASGQLLAANAQRRYLLIQNNDSGGAIYVTLDGTAATTAKGIKIDAGASYECQGYVPSGEIRAIGSIASNANIVTVEG